MISRATLARVVIGLALVAAVGMLSLYACAPVPEQAPEKGSHGYRIWGGALVRSFEHGEKRICVPKGWEPVGAIEAQRGWARFAPEKTGVMIRSSAFSSTSLTFIRSSYRVTLRYPSFGTTPELLEEYESEVTNTFEKVGALFNDDAKDAPRAHTVLVTAGLLSPPSEDNSLYPDPGPNVTYLVLAPSNPRGEELLVHGVMHLYNRFSHAGLVYEGLQSPIPPEDWQELEAVWAETAFTTENENRRVRLDYLYTVHSAVQASDFSRIDGAPFDDPDAFKNLRPSVVVSEDSSYLDEQYGHYVLAPLVMVAVEGLLQKYGAGTKLETLLAEIHSGKKGNFFEALGEVLPSEEVSRVMDWMNNRATIPLDMVLLGEHRYDRAE